MEYSHTNLIGPAAAAESETIEIIKENEKLNAPGLNLFLYHGAPGTGKTSLIKNIILKLAKNTALVTYYNGRDVGINEIIKIKDSLIYAPIFNDKHYIFIDEIDSISPAARDSFLQLSEYKNVVIFATSNKSLLFFDTRFQDRFLPFDISAPGAPEIKDHLIQEYNINNVIAEQIAANCQSVRAAVKDARRAQLKYNKLVKNAVNAA